ncbi:hypothetical protein ACRALDRAFT_1071026 [Sodiomyces alcalophilus JCM 7366]|uniref:uncharacterized protein n=1 Tax=Sodiomyces alcalophilus JCM 7366 TaxID=591952 RepID=UPI0039B53635
MSVDLNWEALTSGPDGEALALKIRDFIHAKFQTVPLPRFIKSVKVHDFEFGVIPPRLELKDITDPLPDFYEENEEYEDDDDEEDEEEDEKDAWEADVGTTGRRQGHGQQPPPQQKHQRPHHHRQRSHHRDPARPSSRVHAASTHTGSYSPIRGGQTAAGDLTASSLLGVSTPGILGGASNLHYFQTHLAGPAWSGTQTPLAAVAGAHHHHLGGGALALASAPSSPSRSPGTPSHSRQASQSSISVGGDVHHTGSSLAPGSFSSSSQQNHHQQQQQQLREKSSVSTLAPTSVNTSRPPTRDTAHLAAAAAKAASAIAEDESDDDGGRRRGRRRSSIRRGTGGTEHRDGGQQSTRRSASTASTRGDNNNNNHSYSPDAGPRQREPRPEDLQAVFRIRYAGDIRLRLTAEILLDYPMPSFVGIPVQLSVTGLTFDGVGVLAYLRRRVHFCFLSPEDAVAAVGGPGADDDDDDEEGEADRRRQQGEADAAAGATLGGGGGRGRRFGGLLQEIRVESEIGLRDGGKQSLKNVGKVERFVLEQVRRIFENEFVYPSFWTFLV